MLTNAHGSAPALGNADRLLQVLSSLVDNALRTAPECSAMALTVRAGEVRVEDEGPGLADVNPARIFEPFYLHKHFSGTRPAGSGLGLAIVKELVEAMGGTVAVENREHSGTVFIVRLPTPSAPDR